jgi:hypothetical protein
VCPSLRCDTSVHQIGVTDSSEQTRADDTHVLHETLRARMEVNHMGLDTAWHMHLPEVAARNPINAGVEPQALAID